MPVWKTLRHNGVAFPDPYVPAGLAVLIGGNRVELSPLAEEMAYQFAKKKDTPYVKDPVFIANFMKDWAKQLPESYRGTKFEDVDLTQFYGRVDREKRAKESLTKEEKKGQAASRKELRERLRAKYGRAYVDGNEIEVANWMAEPPGLFMGRGAHPLRGSWKPRVSPSDVTLNLDEDAPVPPGDWGEIAHDHESVWLAKWIDKLTEREKYVWPHESSEIQQSRNKEKYDKALRIGDNLARLRKSIIRAMGSKDGKLAKVATVCYLIDHLGMRVGDEKDEDEADTVGATTLRVEHIRVGEREVEFDFLGKDSVRWVKKVNPDPGLLQNLRKFTAVKKSDEEIFDGVNSGMVNRFLSGTVPGLTAKVFRTYHATATTELALRSKDLRGADELEKVYHAKVANLEAAIFCNHKRTPPKNWEESLKKKQQKLEEYATKGKEERVKKVEMQIDLMVRTKDYNLNTSLKNYIDPRIYKSWCDYVGLDWNKLYTSSLQRKFSWASKSRRAWSQADEQVVTVKQG